MPACQQREPSDCRGYERAAPTEPRLSCSGSRNSQWGAEPASRRMQGQHWWGNQHQETRPSKDIGYHQDIRPSKDLGHQEVRQLKDRGHQETRQPSRGGRSSRDPRQRKNRVAQHGRSSWAETSSKKEVVLPEEQEEKTELGFGDLCRFYHRTLRAERDDYTSHNVSQGVVGNTKILTFSSADCLEHDRDVEASEVLVRGP